MKSPRSACARGFTLIEIMIAVAIVGVLASVAIPSFRVMNERSKTAERGAVLRAIKNSINSLRVKEGSFGAGVVGNWNPGLPLSRVKRPFDATASGWDKLDLAIDGNLYYSYMFVAVEGSTPQFWVGVQGDVDGDGDVYNVGYTFQMTSGTFVQTSPDPSALYQLTVF